MGGQNLSREILDLKSTLMDLANTVNKLVTTVFTPSPLVTPPGLRESTFPRSVEDQLKPSGLSARSEKALDDQTPFKCKMTGKKLFLTQFDANTREYFKFDPLHGVNVGSVSGIEIPQVHHSYRMLNFYIENIFLYFTYLRY